MTAKLPKTTANLMSMTWSDFESMYLDLEKNEISRENVDGWLTDWSRVSECVDEQYNRLLVATAINTADQAAEQKMTNFLDEVFPNAITHEQNLKEKLLATRLEPAGFDIPLRNMNAETKLYREENLPLQTRNKNSPTS